MVTDCEIHLASAMSLLGRREEAERYMARALKRCAEESRLYPFRYDLPHQREIVHSIAFPSNVNRAKESDRAGAIEFAKTVIAAMNERDYIVKADPANADESEKGELTEREREIYDLLRAGKTRREISEELGIRLNTVRTHARNIYKKLGVHGKSML